MPFAGIRYILAPVGGGSKGILREAKA